MTDREKADDRTPASTRHAIREVIQVVVGVAVLLVALLSADQARSILGRVIGALLIVGAVGLALTRIPREHGRFRRASLLVGVAIIGALLLIDPIRWLEPIGWVTGVMLIAAGGRALFRPRRDDGKTGASIVTGLALIAGGAICVLAFDQLFVAIVVVVALLAVAGGAVGIAVRRGQATVAPSSEGNRSMLWRWIDAKGRATETRDELRDVLFFEGDLAPARLGRFMLMMLFASLISAAGVISDSTAVVIGAMLIAPLITPMMGMGFALVAGWPNRLGRSTLMMLAGSLLTVGVGWMLAALVTASGTIDTNSQIVSRSSPRLVDLVIAVSAGAAGAYALSRKEMSSSMPGAAVAIALVPPLSVVGVTAESAEWEQASGTLLLFLTNLVAIILAGGTVFLLTGIVPMRRFAGNQHRVRTALGAVAALAVVVVGGLTINGQQIATDSFNLDQAQVAVEEWLGDDSPFSVLSIDVIGDDVEVILAGPGEPPSPELLADALAERFGGDVELDLQWIPRQRVVVPGS